MNNIEQLIEHLQREAPWGLPREWVHHERAPSPLAISMTEQSSEQIANVPQSMPSAFPPSSLSTAPNDPSAAMKLISSDGPYSHLDLDALRADALLCKKCRLCEGRNKVVFGVGNAARPLIAFVGEGPGADEDRLGEPFVGRAGALLTAAIVKGLGLRREDIYIANVVKCRPPQNRAPLPDETAACTPYLFRQLELIQPKVIVTLGQPAQMALSGVQMGITKLRGNWQTWRGIKLMPTFHPAYLLRNPPAKKFFWEDLKLVMAELGLPVPQGEV